MSNTFYITTAIAYVNAAPHIGHAMEVLQADVLARYHRLLGDDTYFVTGTDEHGQKLFQKAEEEHTTPQKLADKNAEKFRELDRKLNISYDFFIRTSKSFHKNGCQKLWKRLRERGDIYKDTYKGFYCVGCEAFVLEKDLEEGKCPIHKKAPDVLEEENYFFRLSKYSDRICKLIESDTLKIVPESRKKEMLNIIGKDGLKDVSFSRPRHVLNWGVSVPGDHDQVMYVWCDALTNYITALNYEHEEEKFQKYWPASVHLIGKDILRFHAGIWIGMLLSADLLIPKNIYVHGFITSEGQKMSKTLGNVVDPFSYIEEFGIDAFRYYLLREIPTTDDGDFSRARFFDLYNGDLANALGNLLSRSIAMVEKYFDGSLDAVKLSNEKEISGFLARVLKDYQDSFSRFNLKVALESVWNLVEYANQYVDKKKPWVLAKEDRDSLREVLYALMEMLRIIDVLLIPFLPETAEKMESFLGVSHDGGNFSDLVVFGQGKSYLVKKGESLFPKKEIFL